MATEYFHKAARRHKAFSGKGIDYYLEERKESLGGRWDLSNWKKEIYNIESWSRDIKVKLDYNKMLICAWNVKHGYQKRLL